MVAIRTTALLPWLMMASFCCFVPASQQSLDDAFSLDSILKALPMLSPTTITLLHAKSTATISTENKCLGAVSQPTAESRHTHRIASHRIASHRQETAAKQLGCRQSSRRGHWQVLAYITEQHSHRHRLSKWNSSVALARSQQVSSPSSQSGSVLVPSPHP
ncbi:hypothetical protein M440DRAFT_1157199 [Trichoderma longibrachiatum ATCC 18648]|uniref:Secreted protein n=1 Tax=Trichoderma longibrachiatum ATCC 18648 TaxID=983965 RepID=A0A2T4CBM9_TRILO|nr:hypothetical protein M440DRAFT_1157199 [Trichoderma longibrachiatum ATCC 18648]